LPPSKEEQDAHPNPTRSKKEIQKAPLQSITPSLKKKVLRKIWSTSISTPKWFSRIPIRLWIPVTVEDIIAEPLDAHKELFPRRDAKKKALSSKIIRHQTGHSNS
jgi:hypothetical protein